MKTCKKCEIPKEKKEFSKNSNYEDGLQIYCKSCKKEWDSKKSIQNKERWKKSNDKQFLLKKEKLNLLRLESGGECKKCKEKRLHLLDFHHLDPNVKDEGVSRLLALYGCNNPIIEEEVRKCILLCSNCHRDFHYLETKENITIEEYISLVN